PVLRGPRTRAPLREATAAQAPRPGTSSALFSPDDGIHVRTRMRDDGTCLGGPALAPQSRPGISALAGIDDHFSQLPPRRVPTVRTRRYVAAPRGFPRDSREHATPLFSRDRAVRGQTAGYAARVAGIPPGRGGSRHSGAPDPPA